MLNSFSIYNYISQQTLLMQNQVQAQVQEFINGISHIHTTPPERANQVLASIRNFYDTINDAHSLGFAFFKLADHIMRLKGVNEQIQWMLEQCILDIIARSVANEYRIGSEALKVIFDPSFEYYKHNNLDPSLKYPLGCNRKLNWFQPEVGDRVDVVKPYITSTSFCSWTRGVLLAKENKKFTVKYDNTEAPATYKDIPFFDQLGSRTEDYDWRMNLDIGSLVDGYNRVWYPSTVVETGFQNGSKRVRITFRRFNEKGQKVDSQGNRYDGLGINEDDWIDVLSYRIQKPQKMARQICYYSHSSQQPLIDDTYDLLFEKQYSSAPFWAIMRCNYTRSTSYLHFFQHLCNSKGYEVFIDIMKKKDFPSDPVANMMMIFGYTSFLVPRMGLNRFLPACLEGGIAYLKQNYKQFNGWKLDYFSQFVDFIAKRLYSLSKKHKILNQLRKFLSVEYFKLNLQKNIIGLKYLYELIKPIRPYQNQQEKEDLNNFLTESQIFYKVIQNNVHEQVLSRTVDLIKYMLDSKLIGWKEMEYIWNIIPHSDLRGRSTIQKLLGDISKNFTAEITQKLIEILLNLKETDLTIDKLNLLRTLKDREISSVYKQKILYYLWECLTVKSANIKQNVEEQIESVYRGFISTLKQNDLKLSVVQSMLKRLKEINVVRNEMHLFKEFIVTYPIKLDPSVIRQQGNYPQTIREVIVFLKGQNIYEIIFKLLSTAKAKDKITSILEFLQFVFDNDSDDISTIVKLTYDILGPSDIFLSWAKNLTYRAVTFFKEMYQNVEHMEKFEKITAQGLEAIKAILLDINLYSGNIKILRKRKTIQSSAPLVGPVKPPQVLPSNVGTSTSDYSTMPQKEEVLTFVYVLKSPFECIGLSFLLQLLQYISSSRVYNDVIKLIIQFIVNLDDKIIDQSQIFMQNFLKRVIEFMDTISKSTELTTNVKLQLDTYLNLIQQLFCQTEKNGLANIAPHFSLMEGEILRLKLNNQISGSELFKKQPYIIEVNQNITLWKFKTLLGVIYDLSPSNVDVIKYVTPIEDTSNGKSLSELFFFNEEGVKIQRKQAKDILRFDLLNEDNQTLTEKFERIVLKWFNSYKNQKNILGLEQLKRLGSQNWRGSLMKEEDKIKNILSKSDKDQKGGLYYEEFRQYFVKAAFENSTMVWRLINLSGYRNNLKHKDEPQFELGENSYPRKILSHKYVYDTIYSILSNETFQPTHLNFYRFLGMLETDQNLCNYIKSNIKEFLQNEKCIYRLSYGLETLTNELQTNLHLFGEFYEHNGHVQIIKKLAGFFNEEKSIYKFEQFLKIVVIPNLLRILSLYVFPLISDNPQIQFLKKIKINLFDTPDVIKKIESPDNYAPDQAEKRAILLSKKSHVNFEELYKLAYKIFDNLIVNYDKEFLVRITNEIVKLYGFLALSYKQFTPEDVFKGSNSESLNIRRSCHALIYLYLLKNKDKSFELLEKLIKAAPTETKTISNTYFDLIAIVLEKSVELEPENQKNQQFFIKFASNLIESYFKAPNQYRGTIMPNKTLNGLLSNLLIILQKRPKIGEKLSIYREDLIRSGLFAYGIKQKVEKLVVSEQLLVSHLQPQHFQNYVKCKSEQNRKILMEIIYYLYKYSKEDHSLFFDQFILPIMSELVDTSKKHSLRSLHVGLTNFGSTCYLNSMLQVLNSMDIFRNAIMKTSVEAPLIQQLKSLFAFLFFSERIDYSPKNLLNSFVPPINPGIQQDTTEFLNFLFDQLQQSLKKSPYKNILQELFQGNQVGQMICHSCGAKRERIQQFFTYSVQIEGKYDLHSALEGMHAGELISDCLCESCGNRSDTTKRNVLNVVPNIFFVHLKRIVFNYDIFMNTKIHTRLYFPDELNFEPYTKEGLQLREQLGVEYLKTLKDNDQQTKKFQELALHGHPKEYYQLKLKGIIVHSGTPDVGHYYAILKKENNWVKFDDSRVTSFHAGQFQEECYGGSWVADEWGGSGSSKNAYVLVYQKQFKKDIELQNLVGENNVEKQLVPYQQFSKVMNTVEWYKTVWLDNHSLMLEQHLISESYTKQFLNFVCKMLELIQSSSTIQLISQIFLKISSLSGEVGSLPELFEKNTHRIKKQNFKIYIQSDPKRTFALLFHQQPKVRDFASFYIQRIIMMYYYYGNEQERNEVLKFISEYLQNLHKEAAKNWLRIDGYFKMFDRILTTACSAPQFFNIYMFLIRADIMTYFLDFVLEKGSPLNVIQKKYSLGTKSNPVNFNAGLNIILTLLKRSFGMVGMNFEGQTIDTSYLFHLTDNAILCLSSMNFYERMIKENQNHQAISQIIERLSIQNLPFSESIARVLLKIVNENTEVSDEMDGVLLCMSRFLRITDQFWIKRFEAVLGTPSPFVYQKNIITSLDEEKYIYPSTLENIFPLESLLNYAHINRMRAPLTILNILKTILEVTAVSDHAMDFLVKMPAPSYLHLRYVDWMRPYVMNVINHLSLSEKKKEQVEGKIAVSILYLDELQKRKTDMFVLILGEVGERQLVQQFNSQCGDVEVNIYNIPVYTTDSLPNANGNSAFDKYLTNGRLQTPVTDNSNILKFFKQNGKPLAIKAQPVQQAEEKELMSLFDQDPCPKVQKQSAHSSPKKEDNAGVRQAQQPQTIKKEHIEPIMLGNQQKMQIQTKVQIKEKMQIQHEPKNGVALPKQEVVKQQVNIEKIDLSRDYLRCIEVVNKSDSSKVALVNITDIGNANTTLPSTYKAMVSKTKEQLYFTKANPYLPWGAVQYSLFSFNYIENPKTFFRLYQSPFVQLPQQNNSEVGGTNTESQINNNQKGAPMDIEQKKDDGAAARVDEQVEFNEAMINCQICTYLNAISNEYCEVCNYPLRGG